MPAKAGITRLLLWRMGMGASPRSKQSKPSESEHRVMPGRQKERLLPRHGRPPGQAVMQKLHCRAKRIAVFSSETLCALRVALCPIDYLTAIRPRSRRLDSHLQRPHRVTNSPKTHRPVRPTSRPDRPHQPAWPSPTLRPSPTECNAGGPQPMQALTPEQVERSYRFTTASLFPIPALTAQEVATLASPASTRFGSRRNWAHPSPMPTSNGARTPTPIPPGSTH